MGVKREEEQEDEEVKEGLTPPKRRMHCGRVVDRLPSPHLCAGSGALSQACGRVAGFISLFGQVADLTLRPQAANLQLPGRAARGLHVLLRPPR